MTSVISSLANSTAGIAEIVDNEYRTHWTRGLRQAELIILDKESALLANKLAIARGLREINLLVEVKKYLNPLAKVFSKIPILGLCLTNKITDIEERIEQFHRNQEKQTYLSRDCEMELNTAVRLKTEIIKRNPEATQLSYLELQEKYSDEALTEKMYAFIEARIFAYKHGLSESVGVALFESSVERRKLLLKRLSATLVVNTDTQKASLPSLNNAE
jgi:hypothetical protein